MTSFVPAQRYASRISVVGEDTPVARALPYRERRTVGAWCFLDHAGPQQFAPGKGMHVGAHPHIGLQTFTWLIEGEVVHRDSLGNEQVIRPGQVNLMTAGRGISHTEDSLHDGTQLHAAQLWIALPQGEHEREPAFENYPDLPALDVGGFRATVLAGTAWNKTSPASIHTPLVGIDFAASGAAQTEVPLRADFEYAAMALRGTLSVGGEPIKPGEWLYFAPGRSTLEVSCGADAQLLLLGGVPFGEDIILWWNFVARTQAELEQALADWNAHPNTGGRFGRVREGCLAAPLSAPSLDGVQLKVG
ncbi:pirin family protein [Ottowia thiooxydans]|uniref:pirin family protein n=1 Tax=Ottowia thiooxydans TaxID=219182 RepID=UPI0004165D71|nr:pirin family protein [Ottowia thiooxydans]